MSSHVRLLTGKHHDNSLMPELIAVFRAVNKYPPVNIAQQTLYNSWFLTGLFHHKDTNTHLALRVRPRPVQVAHEVIQHALSIEPEDDTALMNPRELDNLLQRQIFLLTYFAKKLDDTPYDIPDTLVSLARTALVFNRQITRVRDDFYKEPTDAVCEKRRLLAPDVNPFIMAYAAAHLMDIIGGRLRDGYGRPDMAAPFCSYLPRLRGHVSIHGDIHVSEEKLIHEAVTALRQINYRLEDILRAPAGRYLPGALLPERRLAEELFVYTRGFREPNLTPAAAPAADNGATGTVLAFRPRGMIHTDPTPV